MALSPVLSQSYVRPRQWGCEYCGADFATCGELAVHIAVTHIGQAFPNCCNSNADCEKLYGPGYVCDGTGKCVKAVATYPMLIAADANREGQPPVDIQIQFTINGVSRWTPYAVSNVAGRYNFVFPKEITLEGIKYELLGTNSFYIDHPQNEETYFKASYFDKLPEPPPPPPPPPEWPITRQVHVFDNEKIETGWGTWVEKERPLVYVDTKALVGGKLSYEIYYASTVLKGIHIYLYLNDVEVAEIFPPFKERLSGEVDVTGYFGESNKIKVGVSAGPLGFNTVYVDLWATLGYSEEPKTEPESPWNPYWEWVVKNWTWIALGGGGLLGLYLLTRRGPPVIVVPPYVLPRRRREEEE